MNRSDTNDSNTVRDRHQFDVFLSHNSTSKPLVRELANELKSIGLRVWLDEDELQPGAIWQKELERGIRSSAAIAVLVGQDGIGPWEDEEVMAALILAKKSGHPIIPVILPDAPKTPDIPFFLNSRTWVDLRPGISATAALKIRWGITGQRTADNRLHQVKKISAKLETAAEDDSNILDFASLCNNYLTTTRYLRRRARFIARGTRAFQSTMRRLMSKQHRPCEHELTTDAYVQFCEQLKNPYERVMAHAAYLESLGHAELMLEALGKNRFKGSKESSRLLYQAIAHEKMDDVATAQRQLRKVLDTETNKDLLRAAQFNMQVCYEKLCDFKKLNFETFIDDRRTVFYDGERIRDKALAMHLIVCIQRKQPFIYNSALAESLNHLYSNSHVGYAKTLITKASFDGNFLSGSNVENILSEIPLVDANSRAAILTLIIDYLPPEATQLRDSTLVSLGREPDDIATIAKWKNQHLRKS
ncbi:MAG: toll/interleukin-1 receptor domain-containing protein [Pseudomonadota bacterium]